MDPGLNRNAVDTRLSSSPMHLINREPGYEARTGSLKHWSGAMAEHKHCLNISSVNIFGCECTSCSILEVVAGCTNVHFVDSHSRWRGFSIGGLHSCAWVCLACWVEGGGGGGGCGGTEVGRGGEERGSRSR